MDILLQTGRLNLDEFNLSKFLEIHFKQNFITHWCYVDICNAYICYVCSYIYYTHDMLMCIWLKIDSLSQLSLNAGVIETRKKAEKVGESNQTL